MMIQLVSYGIVTAVGTVLGIIVGAYVYKKGFRDGERS